MTSALLGRDEIIEIIRFPDDEQNKSEEKNKIVICPLINSRQFQPASIDVRLGYEFKVLKLGKMTHLEPLSPSLQVEREVQKYTDTYQLFLKGERFILHPGEFVLGSTLEFLELPKTIGARLEGRSSWGRLGILIHSTAGFIDPGYRGNITFELKNMGKIPVPLYPGIRLGQLSFFKVHGASGYDGKYIDSFGTKTSLYFRDKEFDFLRKSIEEDTYKGIFIELYNEYKNNPKPENNPRFANIPPPLIKNFIRFISNLPEIDEEYQESEDQK